MQEEGKDADEEKEAARQVERLEIAADAAFAQQVGELQVTDLSASPKGLTVRESTSNRASST